MVAQNEELDLTNEPEPTSNKVDQPPIVIPYDPTKQREWMRGIVAGILLFILGFIVFGSFLSYWLNWTAREELEGLLTILFAPIIGLVGAATGFYFGAAAESRTER